MLALTELQWQEYRKDKVIGKSVVSWTGWIEEVQPPIGDRAEVWVDMDPPTELFSIQDVTFTIPYSLAQSYRKDQRIIFSGRIKDVQNILSSCQIDLENIEIH